MSSIAKKTVPAAALAALITFALGGEAHAQRSVHHGIHSGIHHGGHHGGIHHGGIPHGGIYHRGGHTVLPYVPTYRAHPPYPTYPAPGFGHRYHNTTHLDYHAPSWVPHNGHFDYQPGHYDVHHTGHWH